MSAFLSPPFLTSLVPLVFKVVLILWGRGGDMCLLHLIKVPSGIAVRHGNLC